MKQNNSNQKGLSPVAIAIAVFAVVVVITATWFFTLKKEAPIKIGAIIALTGASSHMVDLKDAMIMATDEINNTGGINGRKIELIIENSKTDAESGKKAFARIEEAHQPLLYISTISVVSMALAPLAEKHRVPLIGLVTSALEFTAQREWSFRYFMTTEDEIPPIMVWLNRLNIKQLGVLYLDGPLGRSALASLKNPCGETGKIIKARGYKKDTSDLYRQIEALMDSEAIYIAGYVKHIVKAVKQLKKAKYTGKILAVSSATSDQLKKLPEANGIYIAAPAIYNPNYLYAVEVKKKYEVKFSKSFNHFAANSYDFKRLLASRNRVICQAGDTQNAQQVACHQFCDNFHGMLLLPYYRFTVNCLQLTVFSIS